MDKYQQDGVVMRRAMTLIEIVLVIVVGVILSIGTFKALEKLYIHSAKSRAVTELTLESQIALEQIAQMLYRRVPGTVIGYTPSSNSCEALDDLSQTHPVLEWISMYESGLISREYDSFADIKASIKPDLKALNIDSSIDSSKLNIIFAGSMERGVEILKACEGAYGWHGRDSNMSFDFSIPSDNTIRFLSSDMPKVIYEKYYIAKYAYAVTRAENIDKSAECLSRDLKDIDIDNNTLLLFYGYRPWKGETYCADSSGDREGDVTILAKDVSGFRVKYENGVLRVGIDMNRSIKGAGSVHISKQKAVF